MFYAFFIPHPQSGTIFCLDVKEGTRLEVADPARYCPKKEHAGHSSPMLRSRNQYAP